MTMVLGQLPEGVYQQGTKYFHDVPRTVVEGGQQYLEWVPREVVLSWSTDDKSLDAARDEAARIGADFYDPRTIDTGEVRGWLSHGRKRTGEWTANLGAGVIQYRRTPVEPSSEDEEAVMGSGDPAAITAESSNVLADDEADVPALAGRKGKPNG